MRSLSLKQKLIISFSVVGLTPLLAVGLYSFHKSSSSLEEKVFNKLVAVRDVKSSAIKRYFNTIKSQVLTFSQSVSTVDAMKSFTKSYSEFSNEVSLSKENLSQYKKSLNNYYQNEFAQKYQKENGFSINAKSYLNKLSPTDLALQYYYISSNQNPLGSKDQLDRASDSSSYSKVHKKYHPSIRNFQQEFGYYDIFLVDYDSGLVTYSVFKELDYATSLVSGPHSESNLAKAFKKAKLLSKPGQFVLVDYENYAPSYEAPASFIASPIWEGGKKIGMVIFQMPIDRLNTIMSERSGMGETGETYLFGQDRLIRSDSFLDPKKYNVIQSFKNSGETKLNNTAVNEAIEGKTGSTISQNYLGQDVVTAYSPIEILGLNWGLAAEISKDEAFKSIENIRNAIMLIALFSFIAIFAFAIYFSSNISAKIKSIAEELIRKAKNLDLSSDEISQTSSKLRVSSQDSNSSLQRTVSSLDEISAMVNKNAESARSSTQTSIASKQAAEKGKETVNSMIRSIEDISNSSNEIAHEMDKNNQDLSGIVKLILEISERTKIINDIVFQTKLLSFNASVEAARAGEHGKGFAVVAEEIGNLATMSGGAAHEISDMLDKSLNQVEKTISEAKQKVELLIDKSQTKVKEGHAKAKECEKALDKIIKNVDAVNSLVNEIAAASLEQSAGVNEVSEAMRQLDNVVHQNVNISNESSLMSNDLKDQASEINESVVDLMKVIATTNNLKQEDEEDFKRTA